MMKNKNISLAGCDKTMILIIMALLLYGSLMVFSASAPYAESTYGDSYYFVKRQLFWVFLGLVGFTVCASLPARIHRDVTAPFGFSIAAVCLVLVLFSGSAVKRWLNLGFFSFQPSEFMKPMLVLMLAKYMEHYHDKIKNNGIVSKGRMYGRVLNKSKFREASLYGTFIPVLILAGVCVLIMLENHFSGTLITFALGAIVIFAGGAMLRWFAMAGSFMVTVVMAVLFGTEYASERIDIWLHPENFSVRDETWQITQGLIAIGSGGVFGKGFGNGEQKQLFVSAPHNDFIFSIVCEELGMIGAFAVIALFIMFIVRGLKLAKNADTVFSSLTAVGIVGQIGLQAFLNIGVVTGTIPNTGVTLPFFSYGGSALVVLLSEVGILISVTKNTDA